MPPEYITDGTLSKKHDVYGFGVTLLDMVSDMSRSGRTTGQASIEWVSKSTTHACIYLDTFHLSNPLSP